MSQLLNRTATPLVTGLFLVSLVSGVALFFHWAPATFHAMHEWLSIVLILPFALHIWKNWRPMSAYLRRPVFAVAMVASLAAALAFVVPSASNSASGGRPPQFAVAQQVLNGSVDAVASVMGETPEALGAVGGGGVRGEVGGRAGASPGLPEARKGPGRLPRVVAGARHQLEADGVCLVLHGARVRQLHPEQEGRREQLRHVEQRQQGQLGRAEGHLRRGLLGAVPRHDVGDLVPDDRRELLV